MRILMSKKEFADFIRECSSGSTCSQCVLYEHCGDSSVKGPEDFVEIVEEDDG